MTNYPYSADSTKRFSNRVENYIKYRPGYPTEIVDFATKELGLTPDSVVADVGSGTGLLSQPFLQNGNPVLGIEPNREMREAGERYLADFSRFTSVNGTAEATTLVENSVDFVVAGQAFHWFDVDKTKAESQRILRPHGWVLIVFNMRRSWDSPLLQAYEAMVEAYGFSYNHVKAGQREVDVADWFAPNVGKLALFSYEQVFDYAGISGRLLSSSYTPLPDHPHHAPMMARLREIFDQFAEDEKVAFPYETRVYYGQLDKN
jgi:SAM-dependent methyltransferase